MSYVKDKIIIIFQAVLLFSLGFTASCQCYDDDFYKHKHRLNMLITSSPETLDPRIVTSEVAFNISQLIFAPLFIIGEDLLPEPFLATEAKQINRLTYRIYLKPKLYFQNGDPITADDVVYSLESLNHEDVKSPHADKFKYIKGVKAINKSTIEITLKGPFAPFLIDLCSIGIVSKKSCLNNSKTCMQNPNGSGPYQLVKFNKTTDTLWFKANQHWFEGPLLLQNLQVRAVKDSTARILELIKGKANFVPDGITPMQLSIIKRYPEKLTFKGSPGLGYAYLAFNLRGASNQTVGPESEKDLTRRALADVNVRKALALAIDTSAILKNKLNSMASKASGMIPPYHWAKSKKLQPLVYDPKQAKLLLDKAGFNDRSPKKHGRFQLTISTTQDRFRQSIALIYAQNFRDLGIEVQLKIQDFASMYQDIKQGNFEMFSLMWIPVVEPDLFHWIFHSSNIPTESNGGGNRGAYVDPTIDHLIEQARISSSLEKRKLLYEKIELRLLATMPYIPLWFEDEIVAMSRNVTNFTPSRTGSLLGIRHIYIESY
ncbi:MAG: ABC transporter substrate-binding protein [bacterium]|nr:ABC transporter substrate-binding protein [bacterium]